MWINLSCLLPKATEVGSTVLWRGFVVAAGKVSRQLVGDKGRAGFPSP